MLDFVEQKQAEKAEARRFENETNTTGSHKYNCGTCYHKLTGSCKGLSHNYKVCADWWSPNSKIIGLNYSRGKAKPEPVLPFL